MSNGKQFTVTREVLTAVACDGWNVSAVFKFCFCFVLLYNKSLNDWSLGEQSLSVYYCLTCFYNCYILLNSYCMYLGSGHGPYAGLLILHDGAISHNRPQIASDRTIYKKSHHSQKIAHYSQNQP